MKEVKSPRKPFLIYALVVAVIILLLNGILFPNILEQRTEEVYRIRKSYSRTRIRSMCTRLE